MSVWSCRRKECSVATQKCSLVSARVYIRLACSHRLSQRLRQDARPEFLSSSYTRAANSLITRFGSPGVSQGMSQAMSQGDCHLSQPRFGVCSLLSLPRSVLSFSRLAAIFLEILLEIGPPTLLPPRLTLLRFLSLTRQRPRRPAPALPCNRKTRLGNCPLGGAIDLLESTSLVATIQTPRHRWF